MVGVPAVFIRAVRPDRLVFITRLFDGDLSFLQAVEDLLVQTFSQMPWTTQRRRAGLAIFQSNVF
jgi:hypothetical protein